MRMRQAAVVAGLALGLMSGTAKAAYIFNFDQIAQNVVVTGSGSLDLSAGNPFSTNDYPAGIIPSRGAVNIGLGDSGDFYLDIPISGPSNFGSGSLKGPDITSGAHVALSYQDNLIIVPQGYTSGTPLGLSTMTFFNATFESLGLTPGQYVYSFPTGSELPDTITVDIGVSAVPLPASAPMFGAALLALGAVGYGIKRKKAAATA